MSDEEALNVTYPLYHIDNRYSNKSINGGSRRSSRKTTRKYGKERPQKNVKLSRKYRKLVI